VGYAGELQLEPLAGLDDQVVDFIVESTTGGFLRTSPEAKKWQTRSSMMRLRAILFRSTRKKWRASEASMSGSRRASVDSSLRR